MFKLITFDVTGTLLKCPKTMSEHYIQAGKLFGINNIDNELININFKKQWNNMCLIHPNFGLNSIGWQCWWKSIVKSTFINSTSIKLSDNSLNKVSEYLIELYSTKTPWNCEDGAIELLKLLKLNNLELGVISNFDPRLHNILKELNLNDYFSFILTSYETNFFKPDINIFKLAQKNYEYKTGQNLVELNNVALHVGNSIEHDIKGARNAGWSAAFISNDENFDSFKNNEHIIVFKNLYDFKKYLKLPNH